MVGERSNLRCCQLAGYCNLSSCANVGFLKISLGLIQCLALVHLTYIGLGLLQRPCVCTAALILLIGLALDPLQLRCSGTPISGLGLVHSLSLVYRPCPCLAR